MQELREKWSINNKADHYLQRIDVIDIGICPTPTVQFNVKKLKAQGGMQFQQAIIRMNGMH